MKQMAEGRRSRTSSGRRTAGQGDVDWCRQPCALSASIQGQPGTGCLAREGTGAASTRSRGRRDAATLLVGPSVEQQENKRGAQLPGPVV